MPRDGAARFSRPGRQISAFGTIAGLKESGMTPTISCGSPPSVT